MSEYRFMTIEGDTVCLREKDIMKWRHVFSGLSLDEELNKISVESSDRPWMRHKTWFYQLSGYLHKLEKGEIKMAYEHKEGQGSLFKNDKKTKDTQPDYRGSANIDGKTKKISAWVKQGKNGAFLSLSIQDDNYRNEPLPETDKPDVPQGEFDDVPFR